MTAILFVDRPVSFTMSDDSPQTRVEPISLETARKHLRNPPESENDLIRLYIQSAREQFEELTGRQLINAVWEYALYAFPSGTVIDLPRPPLVSVESIYYDDADDLATEFTDYTVQSSRLSESSPPEERVDPYCPPGSIQVGDAWPSSNGLARSVRIRRTCGYGETEAEIPASARWLLLAMVTDQYRNRGMSTPETLSKIQGFDNAILAYKYTALPIDVPRTLI